MVLLRHSVSEPHLETRLSVRGNGKRASPIAPEMDTTKFLLKNTAAPHLRESHSTLTDMFLRAFNGGDRLEIFGKSPSKRSGLYLPRSMM